MNRSVEPSRGRIVRLSAMWIFAMIFFASAYASAQPPKGPVTPGTTFGSETSTDDAVPVAELSNLLKDSEVRDVKVTGEVTDVCPKKGCWLSLDMPDSTKVFVMMKDYGFFVPLELIGKTVVIDGNAKVVTIPVDELRHYAEDAGMSKEEIASITEPQEEIRLTASGIRVVE